jgi:glycosyltransferase involved in cell wall biosynthesis
MINSKTIPNGYPIVPGDEISPHNCRDTILWVGRIQKEQKRPDRFLEIARQCPSLEFKLVGPLDGDPEYCEEILDKVESLPNVEYAGFVKPDKIDQYYNNACALVNTSEYEGFPNTFLEGWQCETPIVSMEYDFDGLLVEHDIGFLTGNCAKTADCLIKLANNVELREQIGKNGRRFVKSRYSIGSAVDAYEEIFK